MARARISIFAGSGSGGSTIILRDGEMQNAEFYLSQTFTGTWSLTAAPEVGGTEVPVVAADGTLLSGMTVNGIWKLEGEAAQLTLTYNVLTGSIRGVFLSPLGA